MVCLGEPRGGLFRAHPQGGLLGESRGGLSGRSPGMVYPGESK